MSEQEGAGTGKPATHRGRVQAQGDDMGRTESEA
jgi:hypothetical protein